jgi:uncharacterized protein (TIGR00369 family)
VQAVVVRFVTPALSLEQLNQHLRAVPYHSVVRMNAVELVNDSLVMELHWRDEYGNDAQNPVLHGGALSSLIDTTASYLVFAQTASGGTTVTMNVDYLRPGVGARFVAKAHLFKRGKSLSYVSIDVLDSKGSLVASGRCVCLS